MYRFKVLGHKIRLVVARLWSLPIVRRTVHTFWQAFLAVFIVGVPLVAAKLHVHDVSGAERALVSLLTASTAAGLATIKTAYQNYRHA